MKFFEEFQQLSERLLYESSTLDLARCVVMKNPVCGDVVSVQARTEGKRIHSISYQAQGCWPVLSCLEFLGAKFTGRDVKELLLYSLERFLGDIDGVPASKRHAFSLSHKSILAAVTKSVTLSDSEKAIPVSSSAEERLH